MHRRTAARIVAVGALMAVLALPASAWAAPAKARGLAGAWTWLESLWQGGISLVGSWSESMQKERKGFDPNGSPNLADGADQGLGVDPNGS